ncbi:MAG: prepilin-type N-terminal cleavage/methylation domain-containing protein [Desulfomonilaceae bacterium]|nr:prepilin-type N-terminal cleavage/methylation domain-containing protein [Desulfomonilaceae bacterium]
MKLKDDREMFITHSERGFSLLEVIVAMLILSIGMLGVGTMILTSFNNDRYNQRVRNAEYLAVSKVEELRALSATRIAQGTKLTEADGGNDEPTDGPYARLWTVHGPEADSPEVRRVSVTVGWPRDGRCTKDALHGCQFRLSRDGLLITQ